MRTAIPQRSPNRRAAALKAAATGARPCPRQTDREAFLLPGDSVGRRFRMPQAGSTPSVTIPCHSLAPHSRAMAPDGREACVLRSFAVVRSPRAFRAFRGRVHSFGSLTLNER